MASINKVIIAGNITRDPDLRTLRNGTHILDFGLAHHEKRPKGPREDGVWETHTNFVDCFVFGARADRLKQILSKGDHVTVEGSLSFRSWESDGRRYSKLEIRVDNIDSYGVYQRRGDVPMAEADPETGFIPLPETVDDELFDEDVDF